MRDAEVARTSMLESQSRSLIFHQSKVGKHTVGKHASSVFPEADCKNYEAPDQTETLVRSKIPMIIAQEDAGASSVPHAPMKLSSTRRSSVVLITSIHGLQLRLLRPRKPRLGISP